MKDIKGFEGRYAVTMDGKIWSYPKRYQGHHNGKFLATKEHRGYLFVVLCKDKKNSNYPIHRLVAEAHLKKVFGLREVNHINGIKKDNRVENLEWCNRSMNTKHAWKTGLCKGKFGVENPNYKHGKYIKTK